MSMYSKQDRAAGVIHPMPQNKMPAPDIRLRAEAIQEMEL
jgi:hypothetical protein